MIGRLLVRPVTIRTRGTAGRDAHGNPTPAVTAATTVDGWLDQQQSVEPADGTSNTVTTDAVLYVPAGTQIAAGDQVVIDGNTWEVVGTPAVRWTPRGEHHIEAQVNRTTG